MRCPVLHVIDILAWWTNIESAPASFRRPSPEECGLSLARSGKGLTAHCDEAFVACRADGRLRNCSQSIADIATAERSRNNSIKGILEWADQHRARTGHWPHPRAGAIPAALGETWLAVGMALTYGGRGMSGGCSLAQLLLKHRRVRNASRPPKLTVTSILRWADAYHRRTGNWPTHASGLGHEYPEETWEGIDNALRRRGRGLRIRSSLPELLLSNRGVRVNHRRVEP
jgi:hypothetical protein